MIKIVVIIRTKISLNFIHNFDLIEFFAFFEAIFGAHMTCPQTAGRVRAPT